MKRFFNRLGITILFFYSVQTFANSNGQQLIFEDHGYVNPFTGGVAWESAEVAWYQSVLAMEWAFVGLSDVLPLCSGTFDWTSVDDLLARVDSRGHQAILRPVVFGPGYGLENYAPGDMLVNAFSYEGNVYDNPVWNDSTVQDCILKFIDGFALHYKNDQRIAYIQMGLAGLWGEHHLDGATYTPSNFPSHTFQKTMINHYVDGFGHTSSDLLTALSLDSAQAHGFFSSTDTSLDQVRFGFFDDSLLIADHSSTNNWRQDSAPALQLALHRKHGWGGEAFWTGCNSDASWTTPPHDCGNGETLDDQALRLGLNYMLGSPAYEDTVISAGILRTASQLMGYKFTATAASRLDAGNIQVTVENTGAAYCPYQVEVCTSQGCGGDFSELAPGDSMVVTVPATESASQSLFFMSPRLDPMSSQKIRWSNASADDMNAILTVEVNAAEYIFANGFESK